MLKEPCLVKIRSLNNIDISQILDILYTYEIDLSKSDIQKLKKDKDTICIVAENSEIITGFAIYSTAKATQILHLYVNQSFSRLSIGSQLIDYIKNSSKKRGGIVSVHIHERNLIGQKFLKSQGFKWIKTNKKEFNPDDGYLMIWN